MLKEEGEEDEEDKEGEGVKITRDNNFAIYFGCQTFGYLLFTRPFQLMVVMFPRPLTYQDRPFCRCFM